MAIKQYWIGSLGPFYYDDSDTYKGEAVNHIGFRGSILTEAGETSGIDHGDLDGLADDDHSQYLKEKASGGTAAETPTHTHADAANCGTVDHGVLDGLSDDDHSQYFNSTRHDADDHDVAFASIICHNNEVICHNDEVVWA